MVYLRPIIKINITPVAPALAGSAREAEKVGAPWPKEAAGPTGAAGSAEKVEAPWPEEAAREADSGETLEQAGSSYPTIAIEPIVNRYFYIVTAPIHLNREQVIPANQFLNDKGEATNEFIFYEKNGYCNLYVNAVLQEGAVYSITKNSLSLIPSGQFISSGTPIIIESVGFVSRLVP